MHTHVLYHVEGKVEGIPLYMNLHDTRWCVHKDQVNVIDLLWIHCINIQTGGYNGVEKIN